MIGICSQKYIIRWLGGVVQIGFIHIKDLLRQGIFLQNQFISRPNILQIHHIM